MFRDEEAAKQWLADYRWPDGKPTCPRCNSDNVQSGIQHKSMLYRCRQCSGKPMFSIKTGTVMEGSNLPHRIWAIGIYLFLTNLKGISSLKLHRELGIGQKAAWFLLHRLRQAFETLTETFAGPVEVDETYWGGKRKNMLARKRAEQARCRRQDSGGRSEGPGHQPGVGGLGSSDRPADAADFRGGPDRARRDGLQRRSRCLRGTAPRACVGPARCGQVRERSGLDQWSGVPLVDAQAGVVRDLSPAESETLEPLRAGVCRAPQSARARHPGADA